MKVIGLFMKGGGSDEKILILVALLAQVTALITENSTCKCKKEY